MAAKVILESAGRAREAASLRNPFRVTGTELPGNVLLMAKVLAICFLLTLHWRALPDHFLPFLSFFDHAGSPLVFHWALEIVFFSAAFCLLFNYHVRAACLVLGSLMFVAILSSRTFYENNRTYTACLWFLAGLQVTGMRPWPLRWQVILLYFGAALNKALDPDWQSGQFFENMVVTLGQVGPYIRISSWFPHLWFSWFMGWTVIIVEFIVAFGFLVRTLWAPIAWLAIAYHTVLLILARNTFGMFYFATLASFLVFMNLPLPDLHLSFAGNSAEGRRKLQLLQKIDLDALFTYSTSGAGDTGAVRTRASGWAGLRLNIRDRLYYGRYALYMTLIYNPLTYFAFAIILSLPVPLGSPFRTVWAVIFLLFMSPALLAPLWRSGLIRFRDVKSRSEKWPAAQPGMEAGRT